MKRDIRSEPAFARAREFFELLYAPGQGRFVNALHAAPRPDGREVGFTGYRYDTLEAEPWSAVCLADTVSGRVRCLTRAGVNERMPAWSPDGTYLALLSDRAERGNFQLAVSRVGQEDVAVATTQIDGIVEYYQWSPDSRGILLGVAGFGADLSGKEGGTTLFARTVPLPAWMPEVESTNEAHRWRRLWYLDLASSSCRALSRPGVNVWEGSWCGPRSVAVVASDSPVEGTWYSARFALMDSDSGAERVIYQSPDQVGWPSSPPSGRYTAFVEAVCSDRWVVCGELHLIDHTGADQHRRLETDGVNVTSTAWRNETVVTCAGRRAFETVIGEYDLAVDQWRTLWTSSELSTGDWYPSAVPFGDSGVVVTTNGYASPPAVAVIESGCLRTVVSLSHAGSAALINRTGRMEPFRWHAPDGLEIQGWLVKPNGRGPWPLIMQIHGGPVHHHTNRWLDRVYELPVLVDRGYALLYPNPRGSNGRGKEFARHVKGDMGGADTYDYLSGIDALVAAGIADPARLGVTGRSYGGFMTAWLISQDKRFKAALPIAPVSDWYSQHRTTHIPHFDELFLADDPSGTQGRYYARSPAMFARNVVTPTLTIVGERDRNTPPSQGLELHRSLVEHGVESTLLRYPQEGHGVRTFPARIDYVARVIRWFERKL